MTLVLFKSVKAGFFTFALHYDVFDVGLQLPRRLGAVHVDGVLPITDNFPSPVGIFPSGAAASVGSKTFLQDLPLESGPWRTPSRLARPLPPQMSQDALLMPLRMSARPSVLPAAGQDDVVDLDALVNEGGCGVARDVSIGVFNDCRRYSKGSYALRTCSSNFLKHFYQSSSQILTNLS